MHLEKEFKFFVNMLFSENIIERQHLNQKPFKNIFRYYRKNRDFIINKYLEKPFHAGEYLGAQTKLSLKDFAEQLAKVGKLTDEITFYLQKDDRSNLCELVKVFPVLGDNGEWETEITLKEKIDPETGDIPYRLEP